MKKKTEAEKSEVRSQKQTATLKPDAGARVVVAEGNYWREFLRDQEPFAITEEERPLLERAGVFILTSDS